MRKKTAQTQEYESCQVNGMDVDMDENEEELSFIPSAVSRTAGWHERRQAAHDKSLQKKMQNEKEPRVNGKHWKSPVAQKRSRGKLLAGWGAREIEIPEIYATKKSDAKNILKESRGGWSVDQ